MKSAMLVVSILVMLGAAIAPGRACAQAAGGRGIVASASGAGHFDYMGDLRTFAFTARKYADGSVKGEAQLDSRGYPARIHLELDCLVIVGRTAYLGGTVTASDNPMFSVGSGAVFGVTDDGPGAPWDRISSLQVPQSAPCTAPEAQSIQIFYPIAGGNVQVR